MPVEIISRNIFSLPHRTPLVHCVINCFSMSAGLAKAVKHQFGGRSSLLDYPHPHLGGIGVTMTHGKMVIHLVTKRQYYHKPTFATLESSMRNLREYCEDLNITEISMPYFISCGLDRLYWPDVYDLILDLFQNSSITVYICKI